MGAMLAKSYMSLQRQTKLQSNVQELGEMLGSRQVAESILANMLGLESVELQDLMQHLGTIYTHQQFRTGAL
ncbi:hypothetical protein [Gorillibacterium sp. sgz5001074]|uniref:hypothetical protein n=1 Tax=Gorillibacterium sp. sgz5001074 TaxID=3446695 RepID=UPI003F67E639